MVSAAAETMYAQIEVNPPYKVEIYTAIFCGHCKAAKQLLDDAGIPYTEEGIIFNGKNHREMLSRTIGEDGAPRIFINNHYIGTRRDLDEFKAETLSAISSETPTRIRIKVSQVTPSE